MKTKEKKMKYYPNVEIYESININQIRSYSDFETGVKTLKEGISKTLYALQNIKKLRDLNNTNDITYIKAFTNYFSICFSEEDIEAIALEVLDAKHITKTTINTSIVIEELVTEGFHRSFDYSFSHRLLCLMVMHDS